jgi:sigma-B regulation protein RsbU (phosphoserine phosphatase)
MDAEKKLKIKELELSSLFEIIRAINTNAPENDLYKIFTWTVRSNLNIIKMALFVEIEGSWWHKASFGTSQRYENVALDPIFFTIKSPSPIPQSAELFQEFWRVIPIKHKDNVLAYVFLNILEGIDKESIELEFVEALSNIIIVAIENKKFARREKEREKYKEQIETSTKVQTFLLPKSLPKNNRIELAANYLPNYDIGGDYYDYIEITKEKFLICIADVSGKGIPAAIFMSNFQAGLRMLCRQAASNKELSLQKMVKELNSLISQNSQGEIFITAFFLTYDFTTKKISYINAGHNFPFFVGKDGVIQRLDKGTIMIGSFKSLPFIHETTFENIDEFMVFCFTDGFVDVENKTTGERFSDEDLEKFITKNISCTPSELHNKLIPHLNNFLEEIAESGDETGDDITILTCKVIN